MLKKGQRMVMDEFAWIILGSVGFILIITIVFNTTISKPLIEPNTLQTSLARGVSYTFTATIRSAEGRPMANVTLTPSGEIKDWISFDSNNFNVDNSTTVRARIDVPSSASIRAYTGSIKVETAGGSSAMSLTINVVSSPVQRLDYRPIPLGDFDVRYNRSSDTLLSRGSLEVNKGLFVETKEAFSATLPDERAAITTDAYLKIVIVESNQNGNLVVEFNGAQVFNQKVGVGEVTIPITRDMLNTTNVIGVRTEGPPFWQFWSRAVYKIESLDFGINFIDILEQQKTFGLGRSEIDNFHHFQLQTRVGGYSTPVEDLSIKINGQTVYMDRPPLALINQTIDRDILGNKLFLSDQNTISFMFERMSSINLKDTTLLVYYYR
ncbi:MAG: hypothetical protein HYT70_00470 [Candidatus Aenigmarchaeota archaeon]|nr:hypothetical protein [Candidatus Aenigmarchaeota archaeon]